MSETTTLTCKACAKPFQHPKQRGPKPKRCAECKASAPTATTERSTSEEDFDLDEGRETVVAKPAEKPKPAQLDPATFEVFVGNVGFVYRGEDEGEAWKQFALWTGKAKMGYGQVGWESTKFFKEGKLITEVDPRKQWLEDHYPHLKQDAVQP